MSSLLLPYDTIIKAHEGDPIAIQAVLDRYAGYIRYFLSLIHISEPTRQAEISYAVFCLKKKKKKKERK